MAEQKKYFWIKLKTDFFSLDEIDFILSQPNGAKYIVLYQMLCLMTANNNGRLAFQVNELMIPYDIEKIVRDVKHFDIDTVRVALELFKRLGLIMEQNNDIFQITNFEDMVSSETKWAIDKRKYRATLTTEEQQKMIENQEEFNQLLNAAKKELTQ